MSQEESLETKLHRYVFEQKRKGKTPKQIEEDLISKGIDDSTAKAVTEGIEANYSADNAARNKAANDNMLYGGLWCGGGLLLTLVTYTMASNTGGVYIITWGPIIYGVVRFCKGASQRT